jgi:pyrimidine-nucleoside phosphorylase
LGGGREKKGDAIDYAVGIVHHKKVGDRVEDHEPLLTIHASDEGKLDRARHQLQSAIRWSDYPVTPPPRTHKIVLGELPKASAAR